jgi:hypothetical protein
MSPLDLYCLLAYAICLTGLGSKLVRLCRAARRTPALPKPEPESTSQSVGDATTLAHSLWAPWRLFCARANPCWTVGCIAYHLAIVTVILGYALSFGILAMRVCQGRPLPDVLSGQPTPGAYHPANIAALIFGNADPAAGRFLFGHGQHLFVLATHVEVMFAVIGNVCLLTSLLRRRMGAVLRDLDAVTHGLRLRGQFSVEHLVVRGLIFLIIQAELVARLRLWPQVVYGHVFLAMTLLILLPFSYVAHVVYSPVALVLGYRRRRNRVTA